jgi:hypothetical protein
MDWYILRMDRPPVRAGNHVHAHIGSSTVSGRVRRVRRDVVELEDATMFVGDRAEPIDGVYLVPRATVPMQVVPATPRPAGGVAAPPPEPVPWSDPGIRGVGRA